MYRYALPMMMLLILVSPSLAGGNLTINGSDMAPSYVNTAGSFAMLNLSLNVTPGAGDNTVNITYINITVKNATISNISAVEVRNSTGSTIASNSTNSSAANFTVYFPGGYVVNSSTGNATLVVVFNISSSASRFNKTAANISLGAVVTTVAGDNVTYATVESSHSQIQDVHAGAGITPHFADTGAVNQTFLYNITPTGSDLVKNISITIPPDFTNLVLVSMKRGGNVLVPETDYSNSTVSNRINITLVSSTNLELIINFTLNTSSSETGNITFNSTVSSGNASTTTTAVNTGVTIKQLIRIHNVQGVKTTALPNGTDYWEFNFTINVTESVSGLIHFKMSNWNNSASQIISLTNSTVIDNNTGYYASLYLATNSSRIFNVTTYYNMTRGVQLSAAANTLYYVTLKMIAPSATPVSSSWWTTYSMLFRPDP